MASTPACMREDTKGECEQRGVCQWGEWACQLWEELMGSMGVSTVGGVDGEHGCVNCGRS